MRNKRGPRRMFRPQNGEKWVCAKCGKEIDELPFIPNPNLPVYHRECLPPKSYKS